MSSEARPDYAAFSRLSADAGAQGGWVTYQWRGDVWAIRFTVGEGGLFGREWDERMGAELGAVCAAVRRELGIAQPT